MRFRKRGAFSLGVPFAHTRNIFHGTIRPGEGGRRPREGDDSFADGVLEALRHSPVRNVRPSTKMLALWKLA